MNFLGLEIYKHRKRLAISRQDLAKRLGVSVKSIQLWEHGQRKPKLDNVKKMAGIFKINVEELTQYL